MFIRKLTTIIYILSSTVIILLGCSKDGETQPQASVPILTTNGISQITQNSAVSGGNITSDGGSAVTARGVCWSINSIPTIEDNKTINGSGSGSFISDITGLNANTIYNVRAYATNSSGTGYGDLRTFTTLSGNSLEYFGQAPPGKQLVPFAENIIGTWQHGELTVSPDGKEIYWTNNKSILFSKIDNGRWTAPSIISFSGQGNPQGSIPYDDNPVVIPDNIKLFFTSLRPISYSSPNRENIWYVERTLTGWSEPKPLPQVINSVSGIHWQVSVANNGNLYFGAITDSMRIYYSRYVDGGYASPEQVKAINNFGHVTCPFVAPDESYIIFAKVVDHIPFLFISFKSNDGQWRQPQSLNQISGSTSFVSRDGKYLFIDHCWISAEIIEELRPK